MGLRSEVLYHSSATRSGIYALLREIERVQKLSSNFGRFDIHCSYPTKPVTDHSSDLPGSTVAIFLTCHHLCVLKRGFVGALGIDDAFVTKITLARSSIPCVSLEGMRRQDSAVLSKTSCLCHVAKQTFVIPTSLVTRAATLWVSPANLSRFRSLLQV